MANELVDEDGQTITVPGETIVPAVPAAPANYPLGKPSYVEKSWGDPEASLFTLSADEPKAATWWAKEDPVGWAKSNIAQINDSLEQIDKKIAGGASHPDLLGAREVLREKLATFISAVDPRSWTLQAKRSALVDENGKSLEPAWATAKHQTEGEIIMGGLRAADRDMAATVAAIPDMMLSIAHGGASTLAEVGARLMWSFDPGLSHKAAAAGGKEFREYIGSKAPTWFNDVLEYLSPTKPDDDPTAVAKAMDWLQKDFIDTGGKNIEEVTGVKGAAEDYSGFMNGMINFIGAKSVKGGPKVFGKQAEAPPAAAAPPPPPGVSPADAARPTVSAYTDLLKGKLVDEAGVEIPQPTETPPTDLVSSGLAKVNSGRFGDMTVEELSALAQDAVRQGFAKAPDAAKVAAVGGAAAALATMYPSEDGSDLSTAAVGAGVLLLGSRESLAAKPDSSMLSVMRDGMTTTSKLLERIPDRAVYTDQMLKEQMNRPDMTKAENDVWQTVLDGKVGTTITAKNLVLGFMDATGNFALKGKLDTGSTGFAPYGMERIGRLEPDNWAGDFDRAALEGAQITGEVNQDATHTVFSPDGDIMDRIRVLEGESPEEALNNWRNAATRSMEDPEARTTLYNLPDSMNVPANNHYGEPNLFGWARSFVEDGVTHVMELQSDLVQHARQRLKPEKLARTMEEFDKYVDITSKIKGILTKHQDFTRGVALDTDGSLADNIRSNMHDLEKFDPNFKESIGQILLDNDRRTSARGFDSDETPKGAYDTTMFFERNVKGNTPAKRTLNAGIYKALTAYNRTLKLKWREISLKLEGHAEAGKIEALGISPMFKDWPKRLVREELARKAGEDRQMEVRNWTSYVTDLSKEINRLQSGLPDAFGATAEHYSELAFRPADRTPEAYINKRLEALQEGMKRLENAKKDADAPSVVRFGTADTVAKVEGWPNLRTDLEKTVRRVREDIQVRQENNIPRNLVGEASLPEYEAKLKALGSNTFSPEHQSIYNRYKDLEKFLKGLDGTPYTDHLGHTWIEVPTKTIPAGTAGPRVQMFGGADPKLLAAIAAAGGLAAWLMKNPDDASRDALISAGIIGGGLIKANASSNMHRLATILGQNLYGDLSKMPQVAMKEMLQNAFDAVKQTLEKGQKTSGEIAIGVNTKERSIYISDNGSGMTPKILGGPFLEIAGTLKETTRSSGGFGVAKLQFLYGADEIEVHTMRDGTLSILRTSGDQLLSALNDPAANPDIQTFTGKEAERIFAVAREKAHKFAGEGSTKPSDKGTVVRIKVPDKYTDSAGVEQPLEVPTTMSSYPVLKSPLFENINVKLGFDSVPIDWHEMGNAFPKDIHTPLFNVKFPWGEARVMATKKAEAAFGPNMKVLSNGLWQFDERITKDPTNKWSEPVPRQFHVDVSPTVKAEQADYPFQLNRQGLTAKATEDFQLVKNYLNMLYQRDSLGDSVKTMGAVEYIDSAGGREKVVGLDAPPLEQGLTKAATQGSKIEVKDGQLYIDGKLTPLLTPADMAQTKVATENYTVPKGTLDLKRPIVHDNQLLPTNVEGLMQERAKAGTDYRKLERVLTAEENSKREGAPRQSLSDYARGKYGARFDRMNYEFASKFLQLRDLLVNIYHGDKSPYLAGLSLALKEFAAGVGYDNMYRGVSAKLPTDMMLINPAGTVRIDPVLGSAGMYGTMIHEITHAIHRGNPPHGDMTFVPAQALLMADLAEAPGAVAARHGLTDIFRKYHDIITDLHEVTTYAREQKLSRPAGRNLSNESDFETSDTGTPGSDVRGGEGGPTPPPAPPNTMGGQRPAGPVGNGGGLPPETPGVSSVRSGQSGKGSAEFLAKLAVVSGAVALGTTLDKDHPIQGGILGFLGGTLLTSGALRGYAGKLKETLKPDPRIRIDDLGNQHEYAISRMKVDMWRLRQTLSKMVPNKARREAITTALDTGDVTGLRPDEMPAHRLAKDFFDAMRHEGLGAGVLTAARENYVTHLWDFQDPRTFGPGMSPSSRFAKARTYTTLQEGEAAGLKPLTKDVAEIVEIYGNSMGRSIANRQLINALKEARTIDGAGLLVKADDAPHSYIRLNNSSMQGWRVHPDIAPSMKFLFEQGGGGSAIRAVEAFNTTVKRMAVSFSLFHAKALLDAGVAAASHPGIAVKALAQAGAPRLFGENIYLKQIREEGVGPVIDAALRGGLKFSLEHGMPGVEDLGQGFYEGMRGLSGMLDKAIPGAHLGTPVTLFAKLNHAFDNFMWGRLHAGIKLSTFADRYSRLLENGVERERAAQMAASYVNDMFGGLNWRRVAEGAQSKIGRDAALAVLSPNARRLAQIALFAPDWTLSTTRAFAQAFRKGTGIKGFFKPTELADLHRQYVARAALYYFAVGDAMNLYYTGRHIWQGADGEPRDWTRIDMGDGRTMQWSKHTMEPIHWITQPLKQFINKLGYIPKEGISQAFGVEYISPHVDKRTGQVVAGPGMESGRLGHLLKSVNPIGVQQFRNSGPEAGVSGMLGVPIYGKPEDERLNLLEQRDVRRALKGSQ